MKPKFKKVLMHIFGLIFTCLTAGCSEHQDPITMSYKAKLTKELIIDNARCDTFSKQLLMPNLDDTAIEKIYHDAMAAKCIQKDV